MFLRACLPENWGPWCTIPYKPDPQCASVMQKSHEIELFKGSQKISNQSSTPSSSISVLIAEDSQLIAKMTSLMLKRNGYATTTVENGELAVKI